MCIRDSSTTDVDSCSCVTESLGSDWLTHWLTQPMSIMEVNQQDNAMAEGFGTSGRSSAFTATGEEGDRVDVVPRSNDVSDPNPATGRPGTDDSDVTRQHRINLCRDTRLATWKFRTLYKAGSLAHVLQEMRRCNIAILGIAEARWTCLLYTSPSPRDS